MAATRTLSADDKTACLQNDLKRMDFVPGFLEKQLGKTAADEYRAVVDSGIVPIPQTAPPEEKFELAYKNWMWVAGTAFSFARERLSDEELDRFIDAEVDSFRQTTPRAAVVMLNLIRAISPGAAFNMIAKQCAVQTQWMMPGAVADIGKNKVVVTMDHCKGLDYPHGDDVCMLGCRRVSPRFFAEEFKVKAELDRRGQSCTMTVMPLL